jgi:carbon monoxide dehydrogenase subunit G
VDAVLATAAAVKLEIADSPSSSTTSSGDGTANGTSSVSTGSAAAAAASAAEQQLDWLLDLDSAEAASSLLQRMEHLTDAISVIKLYMRNAYVNCLDKVQLARACVHSWPYMMNVWVLCAVALGLHDEEDGQ